MPSGLDWDRIRTEYRQKASPEELGPPKEKKPDPFANGGRYTGKPPTYSREKILALYNEGKHVKEIAALMGCHRQVVYNVLNAAKIPKRDDRRKTGV